MLEENDNEIVIEQVVYTFASSGMAKSFGACLNTGTLAICKEALPPIGIYPPAVIDE